MTEIEIRTESDGYKCASIDIPGLGVTEVRAGVDFFRLCWTAEQPVVVNSVGYRGEVTVDVASGTLKFWLKRATALISAGGEPTPAASKKIAAAIDAWLPEFRDTEVANEILSATVERHNRINREQVTKAITQTETHLAELRALLARIDAAGPTEYVPTYGTTYELKERRS